MFVVKDDDWKNDYKSYKSIYFNYFLICSNRVDLFLAMQVRVMAACMESQSNIRSAQSRPRDGRGVSDLWSQTQLHTLKPARIDRLPDVTTDVSLACTVILKVHSYRAKVRTKTNAKFIFCVCQIFIDGFQFCSLWIDLNVSPSKRNLPICQPRATHAPPQPCIHPLLPMHAPMDQMADMCKNITFPQLRLQVVKIEELIITARKWSLGQGN